MKIAIHQPNFFPYMGFFQKMEQVDVFVILSHCQFEKNNYQNRFNYEDTWHTMSVNKGLEPIRDKKYLSHGHDWSKIKMNLPQFKFYLFDDCISDNLLETNSCIIKKMAEMLRIKAKIIFDNPTDLTSSERLVDICKANNAKTYLSGISGKNYLNSQLFTDAGIEIEFQDEATIVKEPILKHLNISQ